VSILGVLAAGLPKIEGSLKLPSEIYAMSELLKALNMPDLYTTTYKKTIREINIIPQRSLY